MPEPASGVCLSECDADCEVGCHEHHAVPWKRHHDPETCPGNLANPPAPRSSATPEPATTPAAPDPRETARRAEDTHRRLLAVSRTARQEKRRRHDTEDILRDLIDPDPCWYDHHGYCQAHSWLTTEPACPHARAKALLTPPAPADQDRGGQ